MAVLAVYGTGTPDQYRSRAWSYALDGHVMYVLNLGDEGTFAYDTTTQQWSQFDTGGLGQWNMLNGCVWNKRPVAGDAIYPYVWELDPTATLDEGWRDISHTVTGGIQTRSRVAVGCAAVRVTSTVGAIDEVNGASMSLSYSDDMGVTWSPLYSIALASGANDSSGGTPTELVWRSLGAFCAPGRIFSITDTGGLVRIDGADAFLNNFDNEGAGQDPSKEGE